jgi:NAD(P)-dependent dehydrogenase (short-subunit alcohol dehydrogenase family)
MPARLDNKVAIVTGATAGIGKAITETFCGRGATVVGMARRPGPGAELEASLGGAFSFIQGDVSDVADCTGLVQTAIERFGRVDLLINNAGYGLPLARVESILDTDLDAIMGVTFRSCLAMCRAVLPGMQRQESGTIVNFASFAGVEALSHMGAYGAAKAAVIQLTKVIAVENRDRGIRANVVVVGSVGTEQSRDTGLEMAKIMRGPDFVPDPNRPPGVFGGARMHPDAVARAVATLCDDDAAELTGAVIAVDRGFSAGWLASTALLLRSGQLIQEP